MKQLASASYRLRLISKKVEDADLSFIQDHRHGALVQLVEDIKEIIKLKCKKKARHASWRKIFLNKLDT